MTLEKKYRLAKGTQIRQEDFGLLFYTKNGPHLYFLPAKQWISPDFFNGRFSLESWLEKNASPVKEAGKLYRNIAACLDQLYDKGVILEC